MSDTRRKPSQKPPPDPSATIEALHQQLREAIEALESGEQWRTWLDFAQRLHRYSFNNLILIWSQRPSATQVAGYTTWQSVGRQVRRGEKAIRVMAPVTRRVKTARAVEHHRTEPTGPVDDPRQIVGFRSAPVFDISQTDGPPVPRQDAPQLLAGSAPDGLWEALAQQVGEYGYRLQRCPADQLDGANGLTDVTDRQVWVRNDVDPAQAVKTLAHELAHVMLHVEDGQVEQCRGIIEVEAESVAHLVLGAHQVDTGAYSFPYVAAWAYPLAAIEHVPMSDIVARTGSRVIKAADQIINANEEPTATSTDALAPIAARITAAAGRATELRDQAQAAALPQVNREVLVSVVTDSHEFFRHQVRSSWVPDYLASRRLSDAVASHQIGYAPAGWTILTDHLRRLGYTDDHIEAAGMATRARTGQLIDRMRDRMIIPLRDRFGDCVAFSGRVAPGEDDGAPKYLNTPTTAIFAKAAVLYGLAENRSRADHDHPVICEGPLDAIAVDLVAAQHNLEVFGVATSGTAFTQDHAILLQYATRGQPVCLAFDGDVAGAKATETAWRLITDTGWRVVTIAEFATGADPAGLFAADPMSLTQIIASSRPAGMVIAERQIGSADLAGNVNREVAAFRDLVTDTRRMPREERVPYVLMLANQLRIDPPMAAALVAEVNPHMMMERVVENCRDLSHQLEAVQDRQQMIITDPALMPDQEHLAITTRNS